MKAAHRESPPPSAVFPLITAYMTSQVIYVAARLGIAELLQDGAKSGNE
ncbi:MAG: methyltransferase, partial [Deltaproteobacteria bacterium]